MDLLVAEAVPDAEVRDLRREVVLARAAVPADLRVRHRHYRRRLRVVKLAAQPGPSGCRNSHLVAVSAVSGGVVAVARWGELWQRGLLAPGTICLWMAACVSPVDCDERPLEPGELADAPRRRKLRPIACAECPLKIVEAIDAVIVEVAPALGPAQLGCGAAGGAGVMMSWLRIWAEEELEAAHESSQDPVIFAGLDLENAYRLAYRSACVRGLRRRAPTLAPLAATKCSCATVTAWQRADSAWRASETCRGGWQGSRLMQMSFCCGLEEGLDASVFFPDSDAPPCAILSDLAAGGDGGSAGADDGASDGDSGGGDAPGSGLGRTCWAGRSPPVVHRREESTPAGGSTVWERAGRHGRKRRGLGAAAGDEEHDGNFGDTEHVGDLCSAGAFGSSGLCWAGRSPPVGPRQEAPAPAGGSTV